MLIGQISGSEYDGFLLRHAVFFAGGMVGVVIGSLMRACGMMMRGTVRVLDGQSFMWWALCSVGKVAGVVLAVGMGFGALGAGHAENIVMMVNCLVLLGLFVSGTVRLHSMRSGFLER